MTHLVNQPNAMPTRKWWSFVIAGAVVNAAFGALDAAWPGHPFEPYRADLIGWTVIAVGAIAAYFTKNKA